MMRRQTSVVPFNAKTVSKCLVALLLSINDAGRRLDLRRRLRSLVLVTHSFFEAFDALGNVTHHVGKAAFTEKQKHQYPDNQPMPDAQSTPLILLTRNNTATFPTILSHCHRQFPVRTRIRPRIAYRPLPYRPDLAGQPLSGHRYLVDLCGY